MTRTGLLVSFPESRSSLEFRPTETGHKNAIPHAAVFGRNATTPSDATKLAATSSARDHRLPKPSLTFTAHGKSCRFIAFAIATGHPRKVTHDASRGIINEFGAHWSRHQTSIAAPNSGPAIREGFVCSEASSSHAGGCQSPGMGVSIPLRCDTYSPIASAARGNANARVRLMNVKADVREAKTRLRPSAAKRTAKNKAFEKVDA